MPILDSLSTDTLNAVNTVIESADSGSSALSWSPNLILALVGGIIVAGFLANLIFKVFKIPSVVKLMGIGLLLGPVFGLIPGEELMVVAPMFGKIALLIILFAGGLGLRFETVIAQLGKAVLMAFLAFGITFAATVPLAQYFMGLELTQAIILATLVAGTASSIVIPVVGKLSITESEKTLLSIESAISNLLILVVVILVCDINYTQSANFWGIIGTFFLKIGVSLGAAIIAGFLWARLIGSMKENSLSYMLTLGFIFLLNYLVDELGGSGAISILFFGMMLSNVSGILDKYAPRIKDALGMRVDSTKFVLNEFLKGISGELSFLVATFFFVFLGLLVSFDALTPDTIRNIGILLAVVILGRLISIPLFLKLNRMKVSWAESVILFAMMPRGLATAVMAFKPSESPYLIPETENFPLYAMFIILGSNLFMTAFVKIGENLLKKEKHLEKEDESLADNALTGNFGASISGYETYRKMMGLDEREAAQVAKESPAAFTDAKLTQPPTATSNPPEIIEQPDVEDEEESIAYSTIRKRPDEIEGFSELLRYWFGIALKITTPFDMLTVSSLRVRDALFWLQLFTMVAITTLGLLMNNSEIVLAALLLSPITVLMNTMALSTARGDVYMFLKATYKTISAIVFGLVVAITITSLTPFMGITDVIRNGIQPTVLDFILALIAGLVLPIIVMRGKRIEIFSITPVIGFLLFPPLATVGYAIGVGSDHSFFSTVLVGGLLSFGGNFIAMLIGAVLSQFILGSSNRPTSEYIQKWHEDEVEKGILHKWFERLHLVRFMESVGTLYSRLILLALVTIAIIIPLQLTFNQIQQDYKLTQNVAELSEKYFEIEGRSHVLTTSFEKRNKKVEVNIWVATKQAFTQADIQKFKDEMMAKADVPVNLRLSQSPTEVVGEKGSDFMVEEQSDITHFTEKLEGIGADLGNVLSGMQDMNSLKIAGISTAYNPIGHHSHVVVHTISNDIINPDLERILKENISQELSIPADHVRIVRIPQNYVSNNSDLSTFYDESGAFSALQALQGSDEIHAHLHLKASLSAAQVVETTSSLLEKYPFLNDTTRFSIMEGVSNQHVLEVY